VRAHIGRWGCRNTNATAHRRVFHKGTPVNPNRVVEIVCACVLCNVLWWLWGVQELVLLHVDPSKLPRETRRWLRVRRVGAHHHIRYAVAPL
jgi:hypothetical protein